MRPVCLKIDEQDERGGNDFIIYQNACDEEKACCHLTYPVFLAAA